jgi:hypothetical protein
MRRGHEGSAFRHGKGSGPCRSFHANRHDTWHTSQECEAKHLKALRNPTCSAKFMSANAGRMPLSPPHDTCVSPQEVKMFELPGRVHCGDEACTASSKSSFQIGASTTMLPMRLLADERRPSVATSMILACSKTICSAVSNAGACDSRPAPAAELMPGARGSALMPPPARASSSTGAFPADISGLS